MAKYFKNILDNQNEKYKRLEGDADLQQLSNQGFVQISESQYNKEFQPQATGAEQVFEKNQVYDPLDPASKRYLPIPTGYEKISGALYPTKEVQQKAYTGIRPMGEVGQPGSFLIGQKIDTAKPQIQTETAIPATKKILTNQDDVIANFSKYLGRMPQSPEDLKNVEYMTTLAPQEVERRLKETRDKIIGVSDTDVGAEIKTKAPKDEVLEGEVVDDTLLYNPEDVKSVMEYAARAGLTFDQTIGLLDRINAVSTADKQKIRDDLGISDVATKLFKQPDKTYQEIYDDVYQETGLLEVRERIKELNSQINQKRSDLIAATGSINKNPWINEASRVGKLRVLNETASADINNLLAEKNQYLDLYDKGVDSIENMMQRYTSQLSLDRQLTAEQYNYLLGEAERKIGALGAERQAQNLRYLPDYLKIAGENVFDKQVLDMKKRQLEIEKLEKELAGGIDANKAIKEQLQIAKLMKDLRGDLDYQDKVKLELQIAKNYQAIIKESRNAVRQVGIMNASLELAEDQYIKGESINAVSQGVLVTFQKMLDPTSVVRESEYARSGNGQSLLQKIKGYGRVTMTPH